MSLEKIVEEALAGRPLEMKEAFEEAIQARVLAALEEKYKKMAMKEEDDEDEDDEDDEDEDDEDEDDEDEDDMDESFDLSDYTVEELEGFIESAEFDQLDEISKKTLRSYVKKNMDSGAEPPTRLTPLRDVERRKAEYQKRLKGFGKATDKLTGRARVNATEEFELDEIFGSSKFAKARLSEAKLLHPGDASNKKMADFYRKGHEENHNKHLSAAMGDGRTSDHNGHEGAYVQHRNAAEEHKGTPAGKHHAAAAASHDAAADHLDKYKKTGDVKHLNTAVKHSEAAVEHSKKADKAGGTNTDSHLVHSSTKSVMFHHKGMKDFQ
jgi:hypothetical protein